MNLYFIAILPPESVSEEIQQLKREMQAVYGAGHALKSPAHITLQMPFRQREENEPAMESALQTFAERELGFTIRLNNFDCFPPRVIFVKIAEHRPLVQVRLRLLPILSKITGLTGSTLKQPFHPHLTIATRDLREEVFPLAWKDFSGRAYSATFQAVGIALLKHNGKFWEVQKEFPFSNHNS